MSAVVDYVTGKGRSLERVASASTSTTEKDVQEPSVLVRLLTELRRDVAGLLARRRARFIDYLNVPLDATGTTLIPFEHRFGGDVRFWVVDWNGAAPPNVRKHAATTSHVLVVTSTSAGTATIRVEEAG